MYTNTEKSTESYTKKGICHRTIKKRSEYSYTKFKLKKYNTMRLKIQHDFMHSMYGSGKDVGTEEEQHCQWVKFHLKDNTKYACLHP